RTARDFHKAADGDTRCSTTKPHPTHSRPIPAPQTADTRAMWRSRRRTTSSTHTRSVEWVSSTARPQCWFPEKIEKWETSARLRTSAPARHDQFCDQDLHGAAVLVQGGGADLDEPMPWPRFG